MVARRSLRFFLASALVLLALALVPPPAAQAAPEDYADFATQTYGDPWDFSNPADFHPQQRWWTTKSSNLVVQNGMLSYDTASFGELALVRGFGAIALPWGRDGSLHPIDASKYTRIAFRLNAQIPVTTQGQVTWFTCDTLDVNCLGGMPVNIKPGWNTYDLLLKKGYAELPMPWSGRITSLTLLPIGGNVASAHVDIDWIRVYDPTTPASAPVSRLAPTPWPGSDYASIVRGDAWDMSQSSDVAIARNATLTFDGRMLRGQNAGPSQNDPFLIFPTPAPFSGTRFHRFSIRVFYDGGFSLADVDGGGMNGRLYWNVAGSDVLQTSQDILIYPGWQTITLDMNQPGIIDETHTDTRLGWAGQTITSFRFDPNEDRGTRNWVIDWVRLGSDRPFGSFDVAQRTDGGIFVAGWAIDPNTTASTLMRVIVDGTRYAIPAATGVRDDVAAIFWAYGNRHGFNGVVPAGPGPHSVCVWAVNIGPGGHGLIGCRNV